MPNLRPTGRIEAVVLDLASGRVVLAPGVLAHIKFRDEMQAMFGSTALDDSEVDIDDATERGIRNLCPSAFRKSTEHGLTVRGADGYAVPEKRTTGPITSDAHIRGNADDDDGSVSDGARKDTSNSDTKAPAQSGHDRTWSRHALEHTRENIRPDTCGRGSARHTRQSKERQLLAAG